LFNGEPDGPQEESTMSKSTISGLGLGGRANLREFGELGEEGRERLEVRCGMPSDDVDDVEDLLTAMVRGEVTAADVRSLLRGGRAPGRAPVAASATAPKPDDLVTTIDRALASPEPLAYLAPARLSADVEKSIDDACASYGGDKAALRAELVKAHALTSSPAPVVSSVGRLSADVLRSIDEACANFPGDKAALRAELVKEHSGSRR